MRLRLWLVLLSHITARALAADVHWQADDVAAKDLYTVLGIPDTATARQIKDAYRGLARQWHPDKNPQNTEVAASKFAELAEAYEILADDQKRMQYDHVRGLFLAGQRSDFQADGFEGYWTDPFSLFQQWAADGWDDLLSGASDFFGTAQQQGWQQQHRQAHQPWDHPTSQQRARQPSPAGDAYSRPPSTAGHSAAHRHQGSAGPQYGGHAQYAESQGPVEQEFEEYRMHEEGGRQYTTRIMTQQLYSSGQSESIAQDFVLDEHSGGWVPVGQAYSVRNGPHRGRSQGGAKGAARGRGQGVPDGSGGSQDFGPTDQVLRSQEVLGIGGSVHSAEGEYVASLLQDCSLAVVNSRTGRKVWSTGLTSNSQECVLMLQSNGKLVIQEAAFIDPLSGQALFEVLWSSSQGSDASASGAMAHHAVVEDDGNLVIYRGASVLSPGRLCIWGAFGCPEPGPIKWRKAWRALKGIIQGAIHELMGGDEEGEYDEYQAGEPQQPLRERLQELGSRFRQRFKH